MTSEPFEGPGEGVVPADPSCAHNWRFVAEGLLWTYRYETGGVTTRTERGYYCTSCLCQRKYEPADGE